MTDNEKTVLRFLCEHAFDTLREPVGNIRYPFIQPGAGYIDNLWDWDSYFTAYALYDLCGLCGEDEGSDTARRREQLGEHAKGCIRNFLAAQREDGYIPIVLTADPNPLPECYRNAHKPFLCQNALLAVRICGDGKWVDLEGLGRYLEYYRREQFDSRSGLYFWKDDIMIGVDNNPACFGRPENSCADVYLNCFLYGEFEAYSELLEREGRDSSEWRARARALKDAVNAEMWDDYTGFYYSQDLLSKTGGNQFFHTGMGVFWKSLPLKIKTWTGFLPLTFGIPDAPRAERLRAHFSDPRFVSRFGVRSLASDEKMYNLNETNNPSNWLGAIWTVANFCVFMGCMRYGFDQEALRIEEGTMQYLAGDILKNGSVSESYHPDTGRPFLFCGFLNWNCLAVSMYRSSRTVRSRPPISETA